LFYFSYNNNLWSELDDSSFGDMSCSSEDDTSENEDSLENNDTSENEDLLKNNNASSENEDSLENNDTSENEDLLENNNASENNNLVENNDAENENLLENNDASENDLLENNDISEDESLLGNNNSFDDSDTTDIMQGLYTSSDDEFLSDYLAEGITNEIARGLRLLEIKVQRNITDAAFEEIITAANNISTSSYKLIKALKNMVPLQPVWIDMCINSCCAFTGDFKTLDKCPYCNAIRYQTNKQSRAQVAYFSIQDRFIIQYQDPTRANQLRYRSNYIAKEGYNVDGIIGDVFDGAQYKRLSQKNYFKDDRDIALLGFIDGFQLFRQQCNDCWIILFINANLPPDQRVKKENLLITSIIPGPKAPKDFNSFMKPIIEELCILEGNFNFNYIIIMKN
jgi:hypothetical protein